MQHRAQSNLAGEYISIILHTCVILCANLKTYRITQLEANLKVKLMEKTTVVQIAAFFQRALRGKYGANAEQPQNLTKISSTRWGT